MTIFLVLLTLAAVVWVGIQQRCMMVKVAEIVSDVNAATVLLGKISVESTATLAKVKELEDVIANQPEGDVPQELVDAVAALKLQAQAVDDLVPDVVTPPDEGGGGIEVPTP